MSSLFFLLAILIGVIGPLCVKILLIQGLHYTDLIFWRSVLVVSITLFIYLSGRRNHSGLISITSLMRLIIGGTLLSLSIYAFQTLSATEINILSRLDLPIFMAICGTGKKKVAATGIILVGIVYSYIIAKQGHFSGLLAIWIATILTSVSYILIRQSARSNNIITLVLPPYVGAGLLSLILSENKLSVPSYDQIPILLVTSSMAVASYLVSTELFKRTKLGTAELTGCFALILTFATEGLLVGSSPPPISGLAALVGATLSLILIFWEEIFKWLKVKVYHQ